MHSECTKKNCIYVLKLLILLPICHYVIGVRQYVMKSHEPMWSGKLAGWLYAVRMEMYVWPRTRSHECHVTNLV